MIGQHHAHPCLGVLEQIGQPVAVMNRLCAAAIQSGMFQPPPWAKGSCLSLPF
jgi:hypothetical protein